MSEQYLFLVAETKGGLQDLALKEPGWTILDNTVKRFDQLSNDDDHNFGDVGDINISGPGFLALARKKT